MAAKKKTTKKKPAQKSAAKRRGTSAPATTKLTPEPDAPKSVEVAVLPKGQARTADGTIVLNAGAHNKLAKATYQVHNCKVALEGSVFVAAHDVKWLPITQCTCGAERPGAMNIAKSGDGPFVATAGCNNPKCKVGGVTYVWVIPETRLALN